MAEYSPIDTESFARLVDVSFTPGSKLFAASWCPTMDLFVVALPLGNRHRLALFRMNNGNRVWDVEVGRGEASEETIVDVAWSYNGLQIAVIHSPPRLSFHSVHDGSEIRSLTVESEGALNGVWWLDYGRRVEPDGLTQLLRRAGNTPGSAHSILQMLPLLDAAAEELRSIHPPLTAINKGFSTQSQSRTLTLPPELETFPSLPPNPTAASISTVLSSAGPSKGPERPASSKASIDRSLQNTLIVTSDDRGVAFLFLEGSYPLGTVQLKGGQGIQAVAKIPTSPTIFTRLRQHRTNLLSMSLELPLFLTPALQNVAKLSTTVCELLTYLIKTLEEMRRAWFGTDTLEGGRDVGRKWIKVLEKKEQMVEGTKLHAVFELTNLLFTGKTSPTMREFLGGSGKLSERGMAQWESTVQGALTVLQEYAQRRVTPACERLIIMLEEARGWSAWSQQFSAFRFDTTEIDECLALCHRMIELSEWLSKSAEIEFERFHEFMRWMKAETSRVTDGVLGELRAPSYDPLEVAEYLENGLLASSLDRWFTGPLPQINPSQTKPVQPRTMGEVLAEVRAVIEDQDPSRPYDPPPGGRSAPPGIGEHGQDFPSPLEDLDRNLLELANELTVKCSRIFRIASCATGRQAVVVSPFPESRMPSAPRMESGLFQNLRVRERLVPDALGEEGTCTEYLAISVSKDAAGEENRALAVFSLHYEKPDMEGLPSRVACCLFQCRAEGGDEVSQVFDLEILDLAFFDDQTLLLVARTNEPELGEAVLGRSFLMSVLYSEAESTELALPEPTSVEVLMQLALQLCEGGSLAAQPLPIVRSRQLNSCMSGATATLACNGRENRRCACIVDDNGQLGEIFDIDAEGDDEEDDQVKNAANSASKADEMEE